MGARLHLPLPGDIPFVDDRIIITDHAGPCGLRPPGIGCFECVLPVPADHKIITDITNTATLDIDTFSGR